MPHTTDTSACIAVVDDDEALRESLAWLLDSVGLATCAYEDGDAFLAVPADRHAAVLLDVRMPGLSGLQVQQHLNERGDSAPVIFMTGHGDVPMAVAALKAGAFDFIEKPFNHQQLIDTLQQALTESHRTRQARSRLETLHDRYCALRPKEQQILVHVAEGMTSREAAEQLGVSAKTVEIYRLRAMKALGAANLAELVRLCVALGLVEALPDRTGE
ncbi:response regulator transcription factor [Billgrantia gudaonensis]|uniref:Two component transcriptional regulator, LuxR family n=1 Tax=Billgrantia gudaonensis TaxID=376427 RepID=A0A1G8MKZ9_9GAMM|nr:response regulator [Halomonas gudaonensis]SDI68537.1 two component transcriptional regulator, LuxR family [Halomonas gudaonensis]